MKRLPLKRPETFFLLAVRGFCYIRCRLVSKANFAWATVRRHISGQRVEERLQVTSLLSAQEIQHIDVVSRFGLQRGEWAPLIRAQGNQEAAIRLECLWDSVAKSHDVDILCGIHWAAF
jgi:hypothetical protein